MEREIEKKLLLWKKSRFSKPLIIRGARQVGKTYTIRKFGKENLENVIEINFEETPECSLFFTTLNPKEIITKMESFYNTKIEPGKTLIFLDEIQECKKAILALRYFKEKMPFLHIIAAGSLLEFVLNDDEFRMPVGRVEFMYMEPMSFFEFLKIKNKKLCMFLENVKIDENIPEILHKKLTKAIKEYCFLGGMPEVLNAFFKKANFLECKNLQNSIQMSFKRDFGKYAKFTKHRMLDIVYRKIPYFITKWIKYSKIDPDAASRDIKDALYKLHDANLISFVYSTSANGLPLSAEINYKKFKVVFLDIGLLSRFYKLDVNFFEKDLILINNGTLAEQFVGQELLAYSEEKELFFWQREKKNSSAEIDYLINVDSNIIPIEVKSGHFGRLKSLKMFMETKNIKIGIKISKDPKKLENDVLSIPFYLIKQIPRFLEKMF
jgi:predicted AAA+ superfamily ATPase